MRPFLLSGILASLGFVICAMVRPAAALELGLPIECTLGTDCFVQNYVDLNPGPEVQDLMCGKASYDGHKGTDFRLLNTKVQADVLAAAAGVVKGVRDGMDDRLVVTKEDRQKIKGRECGNGIVVLHEGGWETQYCHLRRGSVRVSRGDEIKRGQAIGKVGFSGLATFAHVHLSVRKNGKVISPFLGTALGETALACGAGTKIEMASGLWDVGSLDLLADANGVFVETGFADRGIKTVDVEQATLADVSDRSDALVFYARLINLQEGDRVALRFSGPDGLIAQSDGKPLEQSKAQWVAFAGRKKRGSTWPTGTYLGKAELIRDGMVVQTAVGEMQLRDQ